MTRPTRADLNTLRHHNRQVIVDIMRRYGSLSRAELARLTRLSKVTVSEVVDDLVAEGYLRAVGLGTADMGRKPMLMAFKESAGFVLGIEVAPRIVRLIVTDLMGDVVATFEESGVAAAGDDLIRALCALISKARNHLPQSRYGLMAVGIAISGWVDFAQGVVVAAPNMTWAPLALQERLASCVHVPIIVDNEANAALAYEHGHGILRDVDHAVYLSVGYGLGSGMLMNGAVYRGHKGMAGEMGHMVLDPAGPLCTCGNHGCWEMYSSEKALQRMMSGCAPVLTVNEGDLTHWAIQQARQGAPCARQALRAVGRSLGQGIINIANLLNPQTLVVGNGMVEAWEFLEPEMMAVLSQAGLSATTQDLIVTPSPHYQDAAVRGAAALACDAVIARI
ncbi:MAG: hypothetical protein C7B44_12950 [Sulfobacillus thermosulfidooxidans]|nr:MAG: hypothetical protein C7B44_12950 [Sulfobacillus thermosulfidooxidans]